MFALSAFYFLFFAGLGLALAFVPIYLRARGLSLSRIALLSAIAAVAGGLAQVGLGYCSDRLGSRKRLAVASCVLLGASYLFYTVPRTLGGFAPLFALTGVCYLSGFTLPQAIIADWTSAGGTTARGFSVTRIWGTFGFIASLLVVTIKPSVAAGDTFLYWTAALYGLSALPLLAVREAPMTPTSWGLLRGAAQVLRSSRSYVFLICYTLSRLCDAGVLGYLGLYLKGLGSSAGTIATAYWINAVAEIPFVLLTGRLSQRYGLKPLLILAFAVWPVRLYLYSLITTAESVYYVQLLHGFTFGIVLVVSMAYMAKVSPGDLHGTGQGLLGVSNAIAMAVGPLLVGFIGDVSGLQSAFRVMAVMMIFTLIVLVVFVKEPSVAPGE